MTKITNENFVEILGELRDYVALNDTPHLNKISTYTMLSSLYDSSLTAAVLQTLEAQFTSAPDHLELEAASDDWQSLETVPRETRVEVRTATGLIRTAVVRDHTVFNRRGNLMASTKEHGTVSATAWRPLND